MKHTILLLSALLLAPLDALQSTRGKSDLALALTSTALKRALKPGTNDFTFTSAARVTLTSLSVRVVP